MEFDERIISRSLIQYSRARWFLVGGDKFKIEGLRCSIRKKIMLSFVAVDLAETLCADMRKEGLRGRTLTLKLKTSSFEV